MTPQEPGYAFNTNPATTHIQDLGTIAVENVNSNNDSVTIMILYSPSREISTFQFDYDWNNDGSLDLPVGAQIVDSLGVRTLGLSDQVYGPTANILSFTAAEVDSVSRKRNDLDRNDGTAWFGGNLTSAGDDYLLYEASSTALPVTGASMTPGDFNTGTADQSPVVSLISVIANPTGTVTATFNGAISQVLAGDGSAAPATGSGITITDTNGVPIPVIDARPTVTGIGTNTLTLSFTGSGVTNGFLPVGNYQLNFVGNGFVANGRAVDVANNGTQINGFFEFPFTVATAILPGDYNDDGSVDAADFVVFRKFQGTTTPLPNNAIPGVIGPAHYDQWRSHFGNTLPTGAGSGSIVAADPTQEAAAASTTELIPRGDETAAWSSVAAVAAVEPIVEDQESSEARQNTGGRQMGLAMDVPSLVSSRRTIRPRQALESSRIAAPYEDVLAAWLVSQTHRRELKMIPTDAFVSDAVDKDVTEDVFAAVDAVFEKALGQRDLALL